MIETVVNHQKDKDSIMIYKDETYTYFDEGLTRAACREEVGWNSNGDLVCFDLNEYCKY